MLFDKKKSFNAIFFFIKKKREMQIFFLHRNNFKKKQHYIRNISFSYAILVNIDKKKLLTSTMPRIY